jgi:hypothetical protein
MPAVVIYAMDVIKHNIFCIIRNYLLSLQNQIHINDKLTCLFIQQTKLIYRVYFLYY